MSKNVCFGSLILDCRIRFLAKAKMRIFADDLVITCPIKKISKTSESTQKFNIFILNRQNRLINVKVVEIFKFKLLFELNFFF